MAWNEAVVTNEGIKLLSECVTDGKVIITRAEGGEQYSNPLSLIAQKEIQVPRHLLNIAYIRTDKGNITVNVRIQNGGVKEPYYIKQIGLFAKSDKSEEEILFALIQDKDGEVIPTSEENPEYLSEFDFVIPVSNAENISITVTPNTFATLDDISEFTDHLKDNNRHITAEERTAWNGKAAGNHTHSAATQSAAGFMSAEDKKKLDGVAAGANAYTHPLTSGNKHIPSGGSSGQILRWSADGTAVWGADNNTTYSAMTGASASAAGTAGLVPQPTSSTDVDRKYLSAAGSWNNPFNSIRDEPAGMDLNDYHNGGVYYFTSSRNPKNAPVKNAGAWLMVIKETDFFFKQIWITAGNNPTYIRACIADGTFTDWKQFATADNIPTVMTGASASAAGTAGLVPAPAKGAQNYALRGNGTWGPCMGITRIVEASISTSTSSSVFSTTVPSDASYFQVVISILSDTNYNLLYPLVSPLLSCANGTKYKFDNDAAEAYMYVVDSGSKVGAGSADIEVKSGSITVSGSDYKRPLPLSGLPIAANAGGGTINVYFYN